MNFLSFFCMGVGALFWVWGSWPLLGDRSVLFKLHALSVSDTLGSMAIVAGLLFRIPREWPLLVLALIALCVWNTVLGYVLAYSSTVTSRASVGVNSLGSTSNPTVGELNA